MRTFCRAQATLYSVLCGDLNRKEIQKTGDVCTRMPGSLDYTAEYKKVQHCKSTILQ